ncbi:hypothetical protein [Micromonospora avicenniae]|uniref:Uncharacterized protein n=1 Tax=Micromonospora avicenniae TaxID=1198245 RepID=A0A1N6ZWR9_9ACTN|nr:hypothetical protein [Micromonospora avicenniae]SIR31268.1 hypothetical protein SAMN05444858_108142 [Micromonospora avicenniae]
MEPAPHGRRGPAGTPDADADFAPFDDFDDFRGGQQVVDPDVLPPTAGELPEPVPRPADE